MRFAGTLGSVGLGYADYKEVNGVPAQLVGDTYLPSAGLEVRDTKNKGWYEVYQNGSYIGFLRPGGKNGQFKAEGSQVVWPQPAAAPAPVNLSVAPQSPTTDVKTPIINAPQAQKNGDAPPVVPSRSENIPVIQTAAYTPPGGGSGTSITELPAASNLQPLTDAPGAPAEGTVQEAGLSLLPKLLLVGAFLGLLLTGGKKRGKRNRR